jgi:hypothetical protein
VGRGGGVADALRASDLWEPEWEGISHRSKSLKPEEPFSYLMVSKFHLTTFATFFSQVKPAQRAQGWGRRFLFSCHLLSLPKLLSSWVNEQRPRRRGKQREVCGACGEGRGQYSIDCGQL